MYNTMHYVVVDNDSGQAVACEDDCDLSYVLKKRLDDYVCFNECDGNAIKGWYDDLHLLEHGFIEHLPTFEDMLNVTVDIL